MISGTLQRFAAQGNAWIWTAGLTGLVHGIMLCSLYFLGDTGVDGVLAPVVAFLAPGVLMTVAAAGTLRKLRWAPILLLSAFVGSRVIVWFLAGDLSGIVPAIFWGFLFYRGVEGVSDWHTWAKKVHESEKAPSGRPA